MDLTPLFCYTVKTLKMADTNILITGRISYPTLFEPKKLKKVPNSEPRYSCQIMIEKDTREGKREWDKIKSAIEEAKEAGSEKVAGWNGRVPKNLEIKNIKDGDDEEVYEKNPEYKGHWVISCSSKNRPGVVDRDLKEIINPEKIYAGCIVRVDVNFFGYDTGSNGVGCALNHVQFWEEGEPLTSRKSASEAFKDSKNDDDYTSKKKPGLKDLL